MPVPFKSATRIQMQLLRRLGWVRAILIGCAAASFAIEFIQAKVSTEPLGDYFSGLRFITVVLLALAWAASIWRGEGPKNRMYFLSHPVDASLHELSRVVAGAMWLVISVAGAVVVALIGAVARQKTGEIPGLATWISLFTGSLLIYFAVSALSTVTSRVAEVLILMYLGIIVVIPLFAMAGLGKQVGRVFNAMVTGTYGLRSALVAPRGDGSIGVWIGAMVIWYLVAAASLGAVLWWRRGRLASR